MRKLLLCLFSIFSLLANAQKYRPLDSTMIWSTEEVGKDLSSCYVKTECKYYLKGFELNNNRVWNKVYRSYFSYGVSWPACTTYVAPPPVYNVLFGYMNEDTINKKVYFVNNLPPNFTPTVTNTVYDFNKGVGDSMYFQMPSMAATYKFPITAIDSILFSGKYHKRFLTNCYPSVFYLAGTQVTFVEGIGCSLGAFTHTANGMGEYTSNLVCFASPTQTMTITNHSVYANGNCSNITLGLKEEKETTTTIYPNPANEFIFIQNANNISSETGYQIFNSISQIVIEGNFKNNVKVKTEALSNGIYFIKITTDSGSETKKLLIQKE